MKHLLLILFLSGCSAAIDFSGHQPPWKWVDVNGKPVKVSDMPVGY